MAARSGTRERTQGSEAASALPGRHLLTRWRAAVVQARNNPSAWAAAVLPALGVCFLGAAVMIWYSCLQWGQLRAPSWDLGIFSQLIQDYARGQAPIVPIKGADYNLLGDHFHPLLVLLAPLWWLAPSPLTLLIAQDLLFALSAWPLTRLATRRLGPWWGAGLGLAYVFSFGIQGAVASQFHEIALAVPLMAYASVAYCERRWVACVAWAVPLIGVKEDLGLTLLMVGLALAWTARREGEARAQRLGVMVAVGGLLAFALTVLVLLPALSPSGVWEYGLGSGASDEALISRLLTPAVKLSTLGFLISLAGGLGLFSPWVWVAAPTLAWRFLGSVSFYWEWNNWHYNAILMPIMVAALLDSVARWQRGRVLVHGALLASILSTLTLLPSLPLWELTSTSFHAPSPRQQAATEVTELIEPGASVESDLTLLAPLVPHGVVSWVGTASTPSDYVVIDTQSASWGGNPPGDAAQWSNDRHPEAHYTLIYSRDGFQVAHRDS